MTSYRDRASNLINIYFRSNNLFPQTRFAFIVLATAKALPEYSEEEIRFMIDGSALNRLKQAMDLKHRKNHIGKVLSADQLFADIVKAQQVTSRFKKAFLHRQLFAELEPISSTVWSLCASGEYSRRYIRTISGRDNSNSGIGRINTFGGPLSDLLENLRANVKLAGAERYLDLLESEMHHEVTTYYFVSATT